MDWTSILPLVMALVIAIGVPLATRRLRKAGPAKAEDFAQHLRTIGVDATLQPEETDQAQGARKRPRGHKAVGTIKVEDTSIDRIDVIGVATQYGVNYYLDYLVGKPAFATPTRRKKTTMSVKKDSLFGRQAVDVQWKGDETLAQRLDYDYGLKSLLLQADLTTVKGGGISIYPELKREYARIRTGYGLPDANLFKALDRVAGHVKSWP